MHFLITAGGTREYIDPVRFITNASSGRMGYALASAVLSAGHKVTLIAAPTMERPPRGVRIVKVETSAEMFKAVRKYFPLCDCLVMAAAVADYTVARPAKTKIKRINKPLTLKLKPTPDILKWAGKHKNKGQIVVGFALEDKAIRTRAGKKLKEKNLDMIIANGPEAIGADESQVQIKIAGQKWLKLPRADKKTVSEKIISLVESLKQNPT
ncbi:MAG: phosphopantothenoylcysteine decarboxylase domain-containing protein [Planctomycetota bacterium]|jgi:phosphopantothenoylcysteine decarboxylase/phosphopantothenate--cysteine ligase